MTTVVSPAPNMDGSMGLTCITCRVVFARSQLQRDHYKTDWHRYNLKRKVIELPPVNADQFQTRVLAHREQAEQAAGTETVVNRCEPCNKTFQSTNAFDNHVQSKKHKDMANQYEVSHPVQTHKPPLSTISANVETLENEEDWEDASDGEEEMLNSEGAIAPDCCWFCMHVSPTMELNLQHMSVQHGFYVPDLEYCVDLDGLAAYLGAKVGAGHVCLWCNNKGKRLRSLDACQKHMRDKGHCRVAHEAQDMIEFADFYDYSPMYSSTEGQDGEESESDMAASVDVLDGSGWQLQLPSGATIGHRSLMRYYRQKLKPEGQESRNKKRGKDAVQKMIGHYKSLGWTQQISGELAIRKANDIKFMRKIWAKQRLKLGQKQNKLFQFRGREDSRF